MALIGKSLLIVFVNLIFSPYFIFCANEQCIEGSYHLNTPSAEGIEYEFCTPWKNLTCCNTTLDKQVAAGDSPEKYSDTWHKCGNLSKECLKFWQRQECFYQCSPYIYKWKSHTAKGAIEGVPICADQCDAWYSACKNDQICVEDALENLQEAKSFGEICKDKCGTTYKDMYGGGKKLCETLWGSSYKYAEQNTPKDNCMVFWFTPGKENPNMNIVKKVGSFASHNSLLAAMFLLPVLTTTLHFLS